MFGERRGREKPKRGRKEKRKGGLLTSNKRTRKRGRGKGDEIRSTEKKKKKGQHKKRGNFLFWGGRGGEGGGRNELIEHSSTKKKRRKKGKPWCGKKNGHVPSPKGGKKKKEVLRCRAVSKEGGSQKKKI